MWKLTQKPLKYDALPKQKLMNQVIETILDLIFKKLLPMITGFMNSPAIDIKIGPYIVYTVTCMHPCACMHPHTCRHPSHD